LSTKNKHPASGWAHIVIIGVRNAIPIEIVTLTPDDIAWEFPPMNTQQLRTDIAFRSGATHMWHPDARFCVGFALSSITVTVNPSPQRHQE